MIGIADPGSGRDRPGRRHAGLPGMHPPAAARGVTPAPAPCATTATPRWPCGRGGPAAAPAGSPTCCCPPRSPRAGPTPPRSSGRRCWPAPAGPGTGGSPPSSTGRCPRCGAGSARSAIPHHVEWLRAQGVGWLARVDRDVLGGLRPEATRLGEALTALAAAAVTLRARVAPRVPAVDADRADHPRPAPRPARPGRAGLRSRSCRVLARPQPGATVTTPNPPARARPAAP